MLAPQQIHNLVGHLLRHRAVEVYLVHHGDNLQIVIHRQIKVRNGLGLDALRGVHHQQRPFAGGDGTTHLVAEIHMPGGVDKVQYELLTGIGPISFRRDAVVHLDGMALDGDAALFLQLHIVKHLILHLTGCDSMRHLQQAVGQRALAVVDMRYDAEIANILHVKP